MIVDQHFRILAMYVFDYLVSTLFIVSKVSCFNVAYYKMDSSLAGKVCPAERRVFEGVALSIRSCAMTSEQSGSAGIAYVTGTSLCYGCDVFSMFKTGDFQNLPGAEFYRRDSPPQGYLYVGGAIMKFVTNKSFTYDQAHSACATYGQLLRIDTPEKQSSMRNTVMDPVNETVSNQTSIRPCWSGCSDQSIPCMRLTHGLSGCTSYWMQGRFADDDVWRFDNGDPMPMSHTYWAANQPNDEANNRCVVLAGWIDYFWNDVPCTYLECYSCEATTVHFI